MTPILTLTVAEIMDLAGFAGLVLDNRFTPTADDLETEITIAACPSQGIQADDMRVAHYKHVAYCTECADEGCTPLGHELQPPPPLGPTEGAGA